MSSAPGRAPRTVAVVGGGILGLAVAREVVRRRPGTRVTVVEKEDGLARHQTGHNSGVVHAGIYYRPGSLKAELCTRGRLLLRDYCAEHGLAYEECGKLVVAVERDELARLDALERTAGQNGVPGLRRVDSAGITEIEPYGVGLAALHSPATAITDYVAVARSFAAEVRAAGGEVRTGVQVTEVRERAGAVELLLAGGERLGADHAVLCAGLHADRLAPGVGAEEVPRIIPFRGEYMLVRAEKEDRVRGLIYPVPDPRYPFLGVHFTRRVDGSLEVGPNAVLATRREGYRRRDVAWRDLRDIAGWPGFWSMARRHWRTGVTEIRGSLSSSTYMRGASRYVPSIGAADVVRGGAGVRAQAVDRDGSLVDDFRISHGDRVTAVRNAPSPAATSSLAIAEHVVDRLGW
ncbi:L-2-hydroxyglutarate oxidase [Nocardioides sambongensis]|uniref:L-2-hydroxyglutarate oxidase n=1 Tax=Nocardioides sambongensis TaxID=2589074 RepID=UPI00112BAAB6|nr:L-2-hydroxyglutarate oxidase [Nocardioides sambongensis]